VRPRDDASLTSSNEIDHMPDFRCLLALCFNAFESLRYRQSAAVEKSVGSSQGTASFTREAAPSEADGIQSVEDQRLACGQNIRWHILRHTKTATDHRMTANPDELMNRDDSSDHGKVFNGYMARHIDRIGENDIVSEDTVMSDMHVGHEHAILAHACLSTLTRATIQGAEFADARSISDVQIGTLTLEFQILWMRAENRAVSDYDPVAQACARFDADTAGDPASRIDNDIIFYDGVGLDLDIVRNRGSRVNDSCWMNFRHWQKKESCG